VLSENGVYAKACSFDNSLLLCADCKSWSLTPVTPVNLQLQHSLPSNPDMSFWGALLKLKIDLLDSREVIKFISGECCTSGVHGGLSGGFHFCIRDGLCCLS